MKLLRQLIGRKRGISQAQLARRAQAMIDHVIFDVGGSSLAGGTFVLDKAFRLRFFGVTARQCQGMIAAVRLGDIAESLPFRGPVACACMAAGDSAAMQAHSASLATAVIRELGLQSAAFRALPLGEAQGTCKK